jgi:predicted Zn-dependent peptidase
MTSVTVTTLANGLRVASDRMDHVESVSLGLWVGAGTRDEAAEVNGVAHLLEHMAFKGTARRSARDIAEEIEAVGGHLNAYTSRESTAYYAKVLAEHAPLAVDILADILQHSTFDEDELARERDVVLQEIGQAHDTPDDVVFDEFQETAFPDQAMGRPVLGRAEIVASMPRQALVDHMGRTYGGERMVLCAAGRIAHETLVELGERLLATVPQDAATDATPSR